MRVYDNGIDAHRKGLANECGIVRVASRLRSGDRDVDKASFPPCRSRPKIFSPCWPSRVLRAIARARRFGALNCRREWRIPSARIFTHVAVSGAEGTDELRLFFARENAELHAAA
jgi:hypothetical protein